MPSTRRPSTPESGSPPPDPEALERDDATLAGDACILTARRLTEAWAASGSPTVLRTVAGLARLASEAYRAAGLERRAADVGEALDHLRGLARERRRIERRRGGRA